MAKKTKRRPPSRARYEQEHPTISFRADKPFKRRAEKLCNELNCSYADLMKFAVDKVEELMKQRVKELLDTRLQYLERTLEFIDDFLWQILCALDEHDLPAFCPRCQEKRGKDIQLVLRWGHEIRPDGK